MATLGDTSMIRRSLVIAVLAATPALALEEPVAWRGPIVMNTPEELHQAYADLRAGTFIQP